MKKKEKTLWAVIWKDEARAVYCVPKNDHGLIPLEENIISFNVNKHRVGRPKMRWAVVYPIFDSKEEAGAYREGNKDWETVKLDIKILK